MSKMRLKPATIGVVRSAATPQAVKQPISATNSTTIPRPIRGSCLAWSSSAAGDVVATLAIRAPSEKFPRVFPGRTRHVERSERFHDARTAETGRAARTIVGDQLVIGWSRAFLHATSLRNSTEPPATQGGNRQ